MSIACVSPADKSDRALLDLFRQNLRGNLVDEAINAIRPLVDAKVDQIVAELEPAIQKEYDCYRQTVVHFMVNRRGEKK